MGFDVDLSEVALQIGNNKDAMSESEQSDQSEEEEESEDEYDDDDDDETDGFETDTDSEYDDDEEGTTQSDEDDNEETDSSETEEDGTVTYKRKTNRKKSSNQTSKFIKICSVKFKECNDQMTYKARMVRSRKLKSKNLVNTPHSPFSSKDKW